MKEKIEIVSEDKLKHYEKGTYTGSYKGMRYRVRSEKKIEHEGEQNYLCLDIWPEPFCFQKTLDEEKESFLFPFTEEGLKELEDKANQVYIERKEFWEEKTKRLC